MFETTKKTIQASLTIDDMHKYELKIKKGSLITVGTIILQSKTGKIVKYTDDDVGYVQNVHIEYVSQSTIQSKFTELSTKLSTKLNTRLNKSTGLNKFLNYKLIIDINLAPNLLPDL
jgi:hypothetical protein